MQSESIAELAKALSMAQAEFTPAKRSGFNPHFKSHFVTLEDAHHASKPALSKYGLSVTQWMECGDGELGIVLTTQLMHSSGEWIRGCRPICATAGNPQGIGSAQTYARRYDYMGIVGIAPEDDDAEAAMQPTRKEVKEPPHRNVPPPKIRQELETTVANALKPLNWIVPFGNKYRGKRLGDIPLDEAIRYAEWMEKEAIKKNQQLDGPAKTFYDYVLELRLEAEMPARNYAPNDTDIPF